MLMLKMHAQYVKNGASYMVMVILKVLAKVMVKVTAMVKVIKSNQIFGDHIQVFSRCYCGCSEMLVLLVLTVQ